MNLDCYRQSTLTQMPLSFAGCKNMNTSREKNEDMALAERIRIVMQAMPGPERGKQVRLSKIADTSKQVVNHWLMGVTQEIFFDAARRICDEFGFRIEWLMQGKLPARKDDPDELSASAENMELVYITSQEMKMITKFRATDEMGRAIINAVLEQVNKA